MTERKGSLIRWKAECGHWMVCYSLEPTPEVCPDCADKVRDALAEVYGGFESDLEDAVSRAEECAVDSVREWFAEEGITATDDVIDKLQHIADRAREAASDLDTAARAVGDLKRGLPPQTERLTMSEAS